MFRDVDVLSQRHYILCILKHTHTHTYHHLLNLCSASWGLRRLVRQHNAREVVLCESLFVRKECLFILTRRD